MFWDLFYSLQGCVLQFSWSIYWCFCSPPPLSLLINRESYLNFHGIIKKRILNFPEISVSLSCVTNFPFFYSRNTSDSTNTSFKTDTEKKKHWQWQSADFPSWWHQQYLFFVSFVSSKAEFVGCTHEKYAKLLCQDALLQQSTNLPIIFFLFVLGYVPYWAFFFF